MIRRYKATILYDIRKVKGQEEYNSFCNGTFFAPKDKKIIRCGTGKEEMVDIDKFEKQNQKVLANIYKKL